MKKTYALFALIATGFATPVLAMDSGDRWTDTPSTAYTEMVSRAAGDVMTTAELVRSGYDAQDVITVTAFPTKPLSERSAEERR